MNWDYATYEYALSAALLTCAMFGMGASLKVQDFFGVIKSPWGLCLIIAAWEAFCKRMELGLIFGAAKKARLAEAKKSAGSD